MEKSRAIGEQRVRSHELVQLPARQHACCKGGEPSHKSKMEDLTVEVCGENGAYYKVRFVKSIQKTGRKIEAADRPTHGPWRGSNLAREAPVLRESAALKCSRGNAASSDAMSRLTGRDFPPFLAPRIAPTSRRLAGTRARCTELAETPSSRPARIHRDITLERLTPLAALLLPGRVTLHMLCVSFFQAFVTDVFEDEVLVTFENE